MPDNPPRFEIVHNKRAKQPWHVRWVDSGNNHVLWFTENYNNKADAEDRAQEASDAFPGSTIVYVDQLHAAE